MQYRLSIGLKWEGDNYIFIHWNSKQMHPDTPYKTFKKIIKKYNSTVENESDKLPDIPLHELRHTSLDDLLTKNA